MTVVMMSRENWVEKSKKKNDQDQVDGMRQEVYSKSNEKEMYFAKDGIKKSAHCFETITHLQQLPLENPRIRHCTIFLYIPVYRTFL